MQKFDEKHHIEWQATEKWEMEVSDKIQNVEGKPCDDENDGNDPKSDENVSLLTWPKQSASFV